MNYLNTKYSMIHFRKVISQKIYVDKSMLINKLNPLVGTNDCYICVTKPRRFGKTINANMLGAYYNKDCDSHSIFAGLNISETSTYQEYLNNFNVISIDFSRMPDPCNSYEEYINYVKDRLKSDLNQAYGILHEAGMSVSDMLLATGDSFVIILDEWDAIFYESFMDKSAKEQYLKFLKSMLKDQPYVELAYMTGVLPIAKYSSGSELYMFREYNFMNDHIFEEYFGFNEDEVKKLCETYKSVSFEELKQWYDGYLMSNGNSLFNPRSVNRALIDGVCLNYWTETGPMNEVADCIEHNVDEVRDDTVRMVASVPVEVELQGYSAAELQLDTRDEILSAMVVYGFLSYHDGVLSIPNHELMEKYQSVLSRDSMGEVKEIVKSSREMVDATLACDEKRVAEILENVHDREIPFLKYSDENALSCVITLCYLYARKYYTVEREAKSGKGYCDYLFLPKKQGKPAIILELKMGGTSDGAIAQIKEKNYVQRAGACREVLLVGISYDEKKHHVCRIERLIQD